MPSAGRRGRRNSADFPRLSVFGFLTISVWRVIIFYATFIRLDKPNLKEIEFMKKTLVLVLALCLLFCTAAAYADVKVMLYSSMKEDQLMDI